MWTVIYLAQNREKADLLQSELEKTGMLVRVQTAVKKENTKDSTNEYFELSVPETDVEEAHNIIIDKGF